MLLFVLQKNRNKKKCKKNKKNINNAINEIRTKNKLVGQTQFFKDYEHISHLYLIRIFKKQYYS